MTTKNYDLNPYVFLKGRCEEAINFYQKALGAEVIMLMRNKEAPPGSPSQKMPPEWSEKVMHARIRIGNSMLLLSDGCPDQQGIEGFSLSLTVPNPAEAGKLFSALSEGGQVTMPLGKTFFSPAFGMVKDRFGVMWMIYVEGGAPGS